MRSASLLSSPSVRVPFSASSKLRKRSIIYQLDRKSRSKKRVCINGPEENSPCFWLYNHSVIQSSGSTEQYAFMLPDKKA